MTLWVAAMVQGNNARRWEQACLDPILMCKDPILMCKGTYKHGQHDDVLCWFACPLQGYLQAWAT